MGAVNSFLKSFDNMGPTPGVNFKGEDNYQTTLGGIIGIAYRILVIMFLVNKFNNLTHQGSPTKVYNKVAYEVDDLGVIDGVEYNFDMMYFWKPLGDDITVLDVPKRIFDIKVSNTVQRLTDEASGYLKEFNQLAEPVKCQTDIHFR